MSEESVRQPGQSEAIGASSQDGGHREHAELVNGLDGVLDVRGGGLAAAIDGANHPVHGTEPCTDPHCAIQRRHGHRCPRCGPGTYDIIADLDG
jgi:hypothetical protein